MELPSLGPPSLTGVAEGNGNGNYGTSLGMKGMNIIHSIQREGIAVGIDEYGIFARIELGRACQSGGVYKVGGYSKAGEVLGDGLRMEVGISTETGKKRLGEDGNLWGKD